MASSKGPIIFYSWQSDLPSKTNRGLIRESLERACKDLSAELEDAPRVDSDTQGVAGSPDIAATIFSKIDAADVFVADVSIIGIARRKGGKPRPVPNPNVMMELGYAKRALGLARVLMVTNTSFGKVADLPFDLLTKRVETYKCAESEAPKAARDHLREYFRTAIAAALARTMPPTESESAARARRLAAFDQWRATRRSELIANETPVKLRPGTKLVIQLAPAASFDSPTKIDPATIVKKTLLSEIGALFGTGSTSWAPDVDSFSTYPGNDLNSAYDFVRFFDNGIVEYANSFFGGANPVLNNIALAVDITRRLTKIPEKLGSAHPYFLSIDVLGTKGGTFTTQGYDVFPNRGRAVGKDVLSPDVVVIDEGAKVEDELRGALDYCWKAGGFDKCFAFQRR